MNAADFCLLEVLQALEVELHGAATRRDPARLNALLHDDFREFGRSGRRYGKAEMLQQLSTETAPTHLVADCFELRRLGDNFSLLTYRTAQFLDDGTLDRFTFRTSIWVDTPVGWQMSFHQGTATFPYTPQAARMPPSGNIAAKSVNHSN